MTNITKSTFIIPVMVVVLLLACGTDEAVRSRYNIEKRYNDISRYIQKTRIQPQLNDPGTIEEIQNLYRNFIEDCFKAMENINLDSSREEYDEIGNFAYIASRQLSQILFNRQKYDSCISVIENLLNRSNLNDYLKMNGWVSIGQALQANGRWDSAVYIYNYSLKNFYPPINPNGEPAFDLLNLPMHIYNVYISTGDTAAAKKYFPQAEQYYTTVVHDFKDTDLGVAARSNLARLYFNDRQWQKTVIQLNQLTDADGLVNASAHMKIADIYAVNMHRLDTALLIYNEIDGYLKDRDTVFKPVILYKKSLIYLEKGRFQQTRNLLIELENKFPAYYEFNPSAQFAKAKSFEMENNWERAETEYKFLIENFPGTREAMTTHLYLAEKLDKMGRKMEAERWRQKAEDYFEEIASRNQGTLQEALALSYKAELFRQTDNWTASAETLCRLFDKFPQTDIGRRSLVTAAAIYQKKLNNSPTADSLMNRLRESMTEADVNWEEGSF
ncbi:MAG: tetratricopeptide repeat protein [Candidatus Zixiibacteriota bacterium]